MKVTKEDIDKAWGAFIAIADAAFDANPAFDAAYVYVCNAAWDKYIKLKEAFENGSN